MTDLRMRVIEMRWVRAGDVLPHPDNWRVHGDEQREAFRVMMEGVGFAGALLTFLNEDGQLMLIDGHLRQDEYPDEMLPVVVTDLNEDEARELLATHDPISALAKTNKEKLKQLHSRFGNLQGKRKELLKSMRQQQGIVLDSDLEEIIFPEYDESVEDEVKYCECPSCGHKFPK